MSRSLRNFHKKRTFLYKIMLEPEKKSKKIKSQNTRPFFHGTFFSNKIRTLFPKTFFSENFFGGYRMERASCKQNPSVHVWYIVNIYLIFDQIYTRVKVVVVVSVVGRFHILIRNVIRYFLIYNGFDGNTSGHRSQNLCESRDQTLIPIYCRSTD